MKEKRRTTGTIVAILIILSIFSVFVNGDSEIKTNFSFNGKGTIDDPYIIQDVNDLQNISNNLSAHYALNSDIDASSSANWNSGKGFVPVGNLTTPFIGSFNGKGYNITNLKINRPNEDYIGLFGRIGTDAVISNISVKNADVIGDDYVGILIGEGWSFDSVDNCSSSGKVKGDQIVGGLIGGSYLGTVKNSQTSVNTTGYYRVGGVIGANGGPVTGLLATGDVNGQEYVGGLIGITSSSVSYSCAMGDVSATYDFAGGLVGYNNHGEIINCHARGKTSGRENIGGLVGYNYKWIANRGTVKNCFSSGKVIGNSDVGGLIGDGDTITVITQSFWDKNTSGQSRSFGGKGKTTSEMMKISTYTSVGWDFDDIWWIIENNTYPFLCWQDDIPPVSIPGTNLIVNEDAPITFDGSRSTDNFKIINYTWTFDDDDVDLYGKTCVYTFDDPGVFKATLKVTDPRLNSHQKTLTVTVLDITPPTAIAGPDRSVDEDTLIKFNGNRSTDNHMIFNYVWTFHNIAPVQLIGIEPTYTFTDPGEYEITLNVSDLAGNWNIDMFTLTVNDATSPQANAGTDLIVKQGTNVMFNGTLSDDNVGIVKYEWTFNYGRDVKLFGPKPEYKFDKPDVIDITLNVTDERGLWDTDIVNLIIYETTKPKANAGQDIVTEMGKYVVFAGGNSSDNVGIINYTWTFVDENLITLHGEKTGYKFNDPGIYKVILNVSDEWKNWDIDSILVTVEDRTLPVADAGPDQMVDEDTSVFLNGDGSADNVGIINYTWTIEDGTTTRLYGSQARHVFNNPGTFNITLKVTDKAGNFDSDLMTIIVKDITNPKADAGQDNVISCGIHTYFRGKGSSDNVGIVNYTWSFTYGNNIITLYGMEQSFTFDIPGKYSIKLSVRDDAGLESEDIVIFTVQDTKPPSADAGPNREIGIGSEVYLDASLSHDNDIIRTYNWTFEYHGEEYILEGMNVSFIFNESGKFEIILEVTDRYENKDTDEVIITVVLEGILTGRVVNADKQPIIAATIEILASDGEVYMTESDLKGNFTIEIPQGSFQWKVTKDGHELESGYSSITALEEKNLDIEVLKDGEEGIPTIAIILILIIFIIIIITISAIIIFLIMMRKKGDDSNIEKDENLENKEPFSESESL